MAGQDFTGTTFGTNESWYGDAGASVFEEAGNATGPIVVNGNISAVNDPATLTYLGVTSNVNYAGYFTGTAGAVIYVFKNADGLAWAVGYTPQSLTSDTRH